MTGQDCQHESFNVSVQVARLTAGEGGPVAGFTAEVRVRCRDCYEPFVFMGLPSGLLPNEPAVSVDMQEARMPIRPLYASDDFGRDLLGYRINLAQPRGPQGDEDDEPKSGAMHDG